MLRRGNTFALASMVTTLAVFVATDAYASGFAAARFGGERGNPTEFNPTSLYYNPAGYGFSDGTNIYLDVNTVFRTATYERSESAIDVAPGGSLTADEIAANTGEGSLSNLIVSPALAVTTDFGADLPVKFGFGFFVPFGGAAAWDKSDASDQFPGAEDGAQRWYAIDGAITTYAISAGAAYQLRGPRLSLGLSGNLYLSKINTLRARNADGTDNLQDPSGGLKEGRSLVDVSSTDYGIGAGLLWEAWRRKAWIGLSYQSAPNLTGKMSYEGTLTNLLAISQETQDDIKMSGSLPDIVRWGLRVRFNARNEFRLFGDVTFWSRFTAQCLTKSTLNDPEKACEVNDDGSYVNDPATPGNETVIQNLQRNYDNAFGVRMGYSYWFSKAWELQVGASYDANAVPDATVDPALMDMDKISLTLGGVWRVNEMVGITLGVTEVLYFERDTTDAQANNDLVLPSKQPGNQGVYNQNLLLVNTGLELSF